MRKLSISVIPALLIVLSGLITSSVSAKVIHSERSLYRNIIVDDSGDLRCLKFNEKRSKTNQSCMLKSDPQHLVFNYTKLLFSGLLAIDNPKKVLVIGLGGGTMSNALHQLYPGIEVDNVEIDPAVLNVARDYFGFFENENIRSYVRDGRIFIKRALLKKQQYDWIILDAFNGDYIPEHLLTKEFLEEVKSALAPDGILTANTFSISELYAHESATYQAVFDHFYNVRQDDSGNRIILTKNWQTTSNGQTSLDPEAINRRINALKIKLKPLGVDINAISELMSSTKSFQDWPQDTRVLTDQFSPANLLKNSH